MSVVMKVIAAVIAYEMQADEVEDLADLGNEIGYALQPYLSKEMGFELDDFINGIKHGVSLKDGTHDKKDES